MHSGLSQAFHDVSHKPAASFAEDLERLRPPKTAAPAPRPRTEGAGPPWAHDGPAGDEYRGLDYLTDEARMAEMARRNRQRPPHLRSQYAIEMQAVDTTTAASSTSGTTPPAETTGAPPLNRDVGVAKAAIATRPWAPQTLKAARPPPQAQPASSPLARTAISSPPNTAAPPPTAFMLTFSPAGKSAPPPRRLLPASSLGSGASAPSIPPTSKQSKVAQLQSQEDNTILLRRFSNAGQAFDVAAGTSAASTTKKHSTPPRLRRQKEAHAARQRERESAAAAKRAQEVYDSNIWATEFAERGHYALKINYNKTVKQIPLPVSMRCRLTIRQSTHTARESPFYDE